MYLEEEENIMEDRDTLRKMLCDDGDRNWSDKAISQGIDDHPQEVGRGKDRFYPDCQRELADF